MSLPRVRGHHLQARHLAEGSREALHAFELQEVPAEGSAGWGEIWEWGEAVKQSRQETPESERTELARRLNARDSVAEYAAACDEIRQGFALVQAAQDRLNRAFNSEAHYGSNAIDVRADPRRAPRWDNPKEVIEEVERQVWWAVAERLDVWSCLSPSRAKEMRQLLEKGEMPTLSEETILSMAKSLHAQLGTLIEQCVTEVYDYLRPRDKMFTRGKYKSNSPYKVGRRVVLDRAVDTSFGSWHLSHYVVPELKALERVMMMLDGKGTTTPEDGSPLCDGIRALGKTEKANSFDTDYFHCKAFGNGNLHLYFLRADLLLEFNKVAGGRSLPGAEAAE
jgi:hypothetical protein